MRQLCLSMAGGERWSVVTLCFPGTLADNPLTGSLRCGCSKAACEEHSHSNGRVGGETAVSVRLPSRTTSARGDRGEPQQRDLVPAMLCSSKEWHRSSCLAGPVASHCLLVMRRACARTASEQLSACSVVQMYAAHPISAPDSACLPCSLRCGARGACDHKEWPLV